jgi:HEAT repeat protein
MMRGVFLACAFALAGVQHDAGAIAGDLHSPDPSTRTRAACELRELGSGASTALPSLVALLEDGSPVPPAVCGERTWRWGRGDATTSPGEQAASTLVAIGSPAYDSLVGAAKSPAWIARRNAVWALGALGNRRAVPVVTAALSDHEAAVRGRGAWALGALDASESVMALVGALSDPDAGVRQQAAWALGAIGSRDAVEGLVRALGDSAAQVREQAAWALGAIGDARAVAPLAKALKDSDARVRRQAAWALGAIGE